MQLVVALRYKPEGRKFDSRWCQWKFLLTSSFGPNYWAGIDKAPNRNEYQEYFLGVKAAGVLPLSCAICIVTWELQTPGNFRACTEIA